MLAESNRCSPEMMEVAFQTCRPPSWSLWFQPEIAFKGLDSSPGISLREIAEEDHGFLCIFYAGGMQSGGSTGD